MYGKNEKKKMLSGRLYHCREDKELEKDVKKCRMLVRRFNSTTEEEKDERRRILRELLGECGERCTFEPPIHFDYGCNTYIGENFYANFDCVILDVGRVKIGDNARFGPKVSLFTAGHPIDPDVRAEGMGYGYPITVGNNVWIGGNTVINPGVTIGDNTVIGSGSVVTKDIPSNVVAAGNPCRVIREITQKDREYWVAQRNEYYANDD
ncbi:MAG: sugar O-acetyltransferase [Clostridia bacterium]|nr:sugar O-acetyltransferase [Clostridia bacterium]